MSQGPREHSEGVRPIGVWIHFPQNFPCISSSEGSPQAPNKETMALWLVVPSLRDSFMGWMASAPQIHRLGS